VFVAIKLAPGRGVQDIHPIVFRYTGSRPVIPLQLTAVAATTDMRVRTFFLDQSRVAPSNFDSVTLNEVKLEWPSFASNYQSVVGDAVDETGSGLGFVTEYAGPTAEVDQGGVYDPRWDAAAFVGLDPFEALAELERQGQIDCTSGTCIFPHPLVLPLLQRYLPAPAGQSESAFYGCLSCNRDQVDTAAWDADAFSRDYQERVVAPAEHARDLLRDQPYLTRMLTFLSPDEMTTDPVFHAREGLPEVARERWAERTVPCHGATTLDLPDGHHVVEAGLFSWVGRASGMPSAARIELVPESGASDVLLDESATIETLVDDANAKAERNASSGASSAAVRAAACRVGSPFAQHAAWLGLSVLHLLRRRRPRV